MVEFTLADLLGGEMLFPGKSNDLQHKIAKMRSLFKEAVRFIEAGDYREATVSFNAMRLVFDVTKSMYAEQASPPEPKE